ncbi:uncharacterized protein LOC6540968 [Drosophila erecta]|uniref:Protein phosphatase 1 regulatory subunit 35 C-terminal domain-containing protein n=1 Tax=Drosophila erecta TaxID=7220 RepID=B3N758_DROER|nr:uncharacterized protein LOC6540968 [Drosophila erecta]EDV59354.1 uncharacterized protein Dere_GG10545 [Drosophila erecta]
MPHKRRNVVHANQRNSTTRRVPLAHLPSAPPNVLVESCNGLDAEIRSPGSPMAKGDAMSTGKNFPANKLAVPQYNTTVRKQNEVQIISNIKLDSKLQSGARSSIAPKVTQKMNFAPNQAVFRDLVTLNVNDSLLAPHKTKNDAPKKKKSKKSESSKVIGEPQLIDYAEKVDPIVMEVKEPTIRLDWVQAPFDFFGAYRRTYN